MKKLNLGFHNKKFRNVLIGAIALSAVIATGNCQAASAAEVTNNLVITNNSVTQNAVSDPFLGIIPESNKVQIGKNIEDKKVKITLNSCYVDTDMLMFSLHIDSKELTDYADGIREPQIYINNKLIKDNFKLGGHSRGDFNEADHTCDILYYVNLNDNDIDFSKNLNITINCNKVDVYAKPNSSYNISGDWKFDFTMDASKINKMILDKQVNQSTKIDSSHEIAVKNIKIFPYRIELAADYDAKNLTEDDDDIVDWSIKDDKGNNPMRIYASGNGNEINNKVMVDNKMHGTCMYLTNTSEINNLTLIPETKINHAKKTTINSDKAITINLK